MQVSTACKAIASITIVGGICLTGPTSAMADPVSIQGSTTFSSKLMEPYQNLIEKAAGLKLNVIANKSVHGLVALLEGRTQMAMISSSLVGEQALLRKTRPELAVDQLVSFPITNTRIAFIVNPNNPVKHISTADLARALKGEITNWRDLGGNDVPIAIVAPPPGGGVPTTVRSKLLGGKAFTPGRLIEVEAPRNVLVVTSQLAGAIGLAQLGLVKKQIAPVKEIKTDRKVGQELNYVTFGPPNTEIATVIEATRQVASSKLN